MNLSTTPSKSSPRLTLKVTSPPTPPIPPTPSTPPTSSTSSASRRPWLISGAIALGLIGVGFIPISYEVGGTVILQAKPGNHLVVYTPIPGIVESINPAVQMGKSVKKGQVIAQIRSREVEKEIASMQQELATANQQIEEQQRRQIRAAAEVQTAIAQKTALNQQAQLARQLAQATVPSQIQEIAANIHKQQLLLASVETKLQKYDKLVQDGVLPRQKWEEVQDDRNRMAGDLEVMRQSLATTRQKLTQETHTVEIQIGRQEEVITAQRDAAQAEQQTQAIRDRITNLQQRLQQLNRDRDRLTLRASISGIVFGDDFNLKVGKELKPDQGLLEIVNLREGLVGSIDVDEQDINSVQVGKSVRFRLASDKLKGFDANVDRIIPNVKTDQTGQKRTLEVQINVKNQHEQLQNGASGFAYIHSEQVPLYKRVKQEILRLFSWERV